MSRVAIYTWTQSVGCVDCCDDVETLAIVDVSRVDPEALLPFFGTAAAIVCVVDSSDVLVDVGMPEDYICIDDLCDDNGLTETAMRLPRWLPMSVLASAEAGLAVPFGSVSYAEYRHNGVRRLRRALENAGALPVTS